ncbi:MAG: methyltransferase domain-containing protein [Verrucomicrobia bacterium]|nr:MAG: methyltransferase domain-containing protein [Verrucomicrobiota bacterium]
MHSIMKWWLRRRREAGEVCDGQLAFQCNICGRYCVRALAAIGRELPSCPRCGSTVRFRAVIRLLALHCFGDNIALPDFPLRKTLRGAGMSDWGGYARPLTRCLNYTNTFYHKEPQLDITNIPDDQCNTLDFLISSDVLEHVAPPVALAFINARRLLKPGGLFLLTVPWVMEGETREHFPDLYDFEVLHSGHPNAVLHNRTADGRQQEFHNLVFHGGAGATLEMRLFSRAGIVRNLEQAGFMDIQFHDEPDEAHGILWPPNTSPPITARVAGGSGA